MRATLLFCFILVLLVISIGCSSGGNGVVPVTPDVKVSQGDGGSKTACWGLWQIGVDTRKGTADVIQLRQSDLILNVLSFLEPPALNNLSIDGLIVDPDSSVVNVNVVLRHPFVTTEGIFHGFDVRGIVMGPDVRNADGLTPVMNPADFSGVPFGYKDGLLGAPNSFANYDGVWGYKYFADGLGEKDNLGGLFFANTENLDKRGIFREGQVNRRFYDLSWQQTTPPVTFLVFNYAVYANYNWPVGDPPYSIDDFSITTANSAEAFCGALDLTVNSLWFSNSSGGGTLSLDAEIFDWQGLESTEVSLFAGDGVIDDTAPTSVTDGPTSKSKIYHFVDVPAAPTGPGDIYVYVKATDSETFGSAWFLGLLPDTHPLFGERVYTLFREKVTVTECPEPTVTGIDPPIGGGGDVLTGVSVTGTNFVAGANLAVKLKKAGQADIVATNEAFVSATEITCDITLPTMAAGGAWDVEVTNGCGTVGVGPGLFNVIACGVMNGIPGYDVVIVGGNPHDYWADYVGAAATQTGTAYVFSVTRWNYTFNEIGAMLESTTWSGNCTYFSDTTGVGIISRDIVCDSQNNVYFTDATDYTRLRYFPFNASTGFGSLVNFGNITSGWSIWRITIDENDRPVILASSGTSMQVFHWNGSGWDTTAIPSSVVNGQPTAVADFDWNPLQDHYVLVRDMGGSPRTANLYAIDKSGNLVKTVTNIFNNNNFTNGPGIYIDVKDPACRIVAWGGYVSYGNNPCPFVRMNGAYGGLVVNVYNPPSWAINQCIDGPRGQWAKGTNHLITAAHYINVWAKVSLPSGW